MKPRSRATAEHEAGHAAMALALFVPISGVELTPEHPTDRGGTYLPAGESSRIADALVDAAGPAADVLSGRFSDRWRRHVPRGWQYDFASMRDLGFSPKECRALVDFAAAMLHGQLRALHARITEALLERDLGHDDLQALFLGERVD